MKAEELRIGNYVNYNDGSGHDDIRKVVGIDQNSVTSIVKGCHFATAIRSNDLIYPIPLSEEVLLKCPEIKPSSWMPEMWTIRDLKSQFHIVKMKGRFVFRGLGMSVTYVDTLHHLQNLVYVNTGEELEVTL